MKQTSKIFSIAFYNQKPVLVDIETITSGGMYRFEILGLNQKNATTLKQKIYTALRSGHLLNLKSDNRKIYTSIQSDVDIDNAQPSELAILTSCYNCITKKNFHENSIILGKISISGEVLPTNILTQSIHLAIDRDIKTIICPEVDFNKIEKRVLDTAYSMGIFIYKISDIQELFTLKKENPSNTCPPETHDTVDISQNVIQNIKENDFLWSLFVSMCGNHHLLIYINKTVDMDFVLKTVSDIHPIYSGNDLINLSHTLCLKDSDIPNTPYYTTRQDIRLSNNPVKQLFYFTNCPCENIEKDCTCNIRIKKSYKTKLLKNIEQTHTIKTTLEENPATPVGINFSLQIRELVKKTQNLDGSILPEISETVLSYYHETCAKMSAIEKNTVLDVMKTIQKIDSILENKPIEVTKKTILLAFSMVRSRLN